MELVVENENLQRALQLRKEGNPEALVWLEKACLQGDGVALFFKGQALFHGGFFLKKDHHGAEVCYEQSAKASCPWGMVHHGDLCRRDEKLAWYAKALATNDDYVCGRCYLFGRGVEKNREKARECLLREAQQGNPFAQTLIADQIFCKFFEEDMLCKTIEESIFWLEKAAIYGDADAQYLLGWNYDNRYGKGVEKRREKAFFWGLQGAKQKHSICHVALCYEKGFGCEKNLPMSAVFYLERGDTSYINRRLSAQFDDPIIRLQELFVYGKGLKKDAKLRSRVREDNFTNAIRIYEESTAAATKAVLCFIWICEQSKCLNRDMQRTIGKIVFESRENPSVWNVALTEKIPITKGRSRKKRK